MDILRLEQLKRQLILFRGHMSLVDRVAALGRVAAAMARKMLPAADFRAFLRGVQRDEAAARAVAAAPEQGSVAVTVVGARRLPKMDLLGTLNPYCLVLLSGDKCARSLSYLSLPLSVSPSLCLFSSLSLSLC